ncbi:hypothetical protein [Pontibacter harenae]|uniref:hypothetical protein n=1 Tax=Pontibacter harenae TaxID=2894083 RepID=UPI001E4FFEFD|nr:hypothetical protein [Pontibacter harenae]MCC9165526.1 hypothetical protein [Pontibacter harenae]
MKRWLTFNFLLCCGLALNAQAQAKFKIGDKVEVFSSGDAAHGIVVGAYRDTDFGYGTYQVHLDGEKYCNNHALDTRVSSSFVQARFQPNSEVQFAVGKTAEVRRWDGKVYTGQIVGKDENKYQVKYSRDGMESSEWFHAYNMRSTAKTNATTAQTKTKTNPVNPNLSTVASWPGQKVKVGDRVMYDGLGFLVTKGWGTVIGIDPEKRLYTVKDEKDASLRYSYPCYQVLNPSSKIDNSFFVGKWEVHVGGATSTFTKNGDLYRRFSGGMKLPPLEIKANGTYTWVTLDGKVVRGKWVNRAGVPGIVLLKALDGLDYTLYEKTEAFATTENTRDEIGLHHLPSSTGYFQAYRMGANKSEVLAGRNFKK